MDGSISAEVVTSRDHFGKDNLYFKSYRIGILSFWTRKFFDILKHTLWIWYDTYSAYCTNIDLRPCIFNTYIIIPFHKLSHIVSFRILTSNSALVDFTILFKISEEFWLYTYILVRHFVFYYEMVYRCSFIVKDKLRRQMTMLFRLLFLVSCAVKNKSEGHTKLNIRWWNK